MQENEPCHCRGSLSNRLNADGSRCEGSHFVENVLITIFLFSLILFLGSALLTHGSYIKIGCLHFTFSIVQQNAPPAISSAFGGTKKEQVALADGGDAVKTEEPLVT